MNFLRLVTADSLPHKYIGRYILMEMHLSEWRGVDALWRCWLRHCTKNRKVAVWIPMVAWGSTQSLSYLRT